MANDGGIKLAPEHKYAVDMKKVQAQTDQMKIRLGWFGMIFGQHEPKIYLGFIVIAFCFTIIFMAFLQSKNWESVKDCWQALGPVITGALGYIFGYGSKAPQVIDD